MTRHPGRHRGHARPSTAGTSGATVTNSGTSSVTITGTVAQVNALLNTNPTSTVLDVYSTDTPSATSTLTLTVHDNGNTGTGGDLGSTATSTINITADDAPVATITPASYSNTEQVVLNLKKIGLSIADVDAGSRLDDGHRGEKGHRREAGGSRARWSRLPERWSAHVTGTVAQITCC